MLCAIAFENRVRSFPLRFVSWRRMLRCLLASRFHSREPRLSFDFWHSARFHSVADAAFGGGVVEVLAAAVAPADCQGVLGPVVPAGAAYRVLFLRQGPEFSRGTVVEVHLPGAVFRLDVPSSRFRRALDERRCPDVHPVRDRLLEAYFADCGQLDGAAVDDPHPFGDPDCVSMLAIARLSGNEERLWVRSSSLDVPGNALGLLFPLGLFLGIECLCQLHAVVVVRFFPRVVGVGRVLDGGPPDRLEDVLQPRMVGFSASPGTGRTARRASPGSF